MESAVGESLRPMEAAPLTLLFDADDTLWENNIYFERAIAAFIAYLDHRVHTPAEVREHLNQCERETIARMGYGLRSFRQSLLDCMEQLSGAPATAERRAQIAAFADGIATQEVEVLPEVAATLEELQSRHRLIVVTKGVLEEQMEKLVRSGLQRFFTGVEVLSEKNREAYLEVVTKYACEPRRTWMIGNSPRSDVNPALAAGLNAVFVPHRATWVLEHESLERPTEPGRLLELSGFGELRTRF